MKRAVKLGLPLALSAALVMSVPGSTESGPNIASATITADQKAGYDRLFAAAEAYWTKRGVRDLRDTNIRYISGRDIGYCALFITVHSGDDSIYCAPNDTIFMTAQDVTSIPPESYEGMFLAGHEYGHRVKDVAGRFWNTPRADELGATCLAGEFMIDVYPVQVLSAAFSDAVDKTNVTEVVGGDDLMHGTAEEELHALAQGITEHDCRQYGMPY